jgi:hypothetical protein
MLNKLHNWCRRWRVLINTEKSKCIHFRKTRTKGTEFEFTIGTNKLEIEVNYKNLSESYLLILAFFQKCRTG